MPAIFGKIFFYLDYKSYKTCLEVSKAWENMLKSESYQRKGKSVFHIDIQKDETKLLHALLYAVMQ